MLNCDLSDVLYASVVKCNTQFGKCLAYISPKRSGIHFSSVTITLTLLQNDSRKKKQTTISHLRKSAIHSPPFRFGLPITRHSTAKQNRLTPTEFITEHQFNVHVLAKQLEKETFQAATLF